MVVCLQLMNETVMMQWDSGNQCYQGLPGGHASLEGLSEPAGRIAVFDIVTASPVVQMAGSLTAPAAGTAACGSQTRCSLQLQAQLLLPSGCRLELSSEAAAAAGGLRAKLLVRHMLGAYVPMEVDVLSTQTREDGGPVAVDVQVRIVAVVSNFAHRAHHAPVACDTSLPL